LACTAWPVSRATSRSICAWSWLTTSFSGRSTDTTIIAAVAEGRSPCEAAPASQAESTRVCGRLTRSRTSRGPWLFSSAAGPRSRIGTSWVGPKWAFASCWAREDSVPGTTTIDGESECATPSPMTLSTTATAPHASRAAFGRLIESRARRIINRKLGRAAGRAHRGPARVRISSYMRAGQMAARPPDLARPSRAWIERRRSIRLGEQRARLGTGLHGADQDRQHGAEQRRGKAVVVDQLEHRHTEPQGEHQVGELLAGVRGRLEASVKRARGREAGEGDAQRLQPLGQAPAQALVALGVDPQLHEQPKRIRIGLELLHPPRAPGQRALPGDALAVEQGDLLDDLPGQMLLHQRQQQVLLAAEVPVHGALGEARLGRDLFERRPVEAPSRIHAGGGLEQPPAGLGLARTAIELAPRHQSLDLVAAMAASATLAGPGGLLDRYHSVDILIRMA